VPVQRFQLVHTLLPAVMFPVVIGPMKQMIQFRNKVLQSTSTVLPDL
jgi:hypothetical protein